MSYYRQGPHRPGGGSITIGLPPVTPVFRGIVIACAAVFLLQLALPELITRWFALTPALTVRGMLWQPLTYLVLHGGLSHLFFNMLMLWMFGGELERAWGARGFLRYYLVCGVGAAAAVVIQSYAGLGSEPTVPTIGASGAIYGVIMAYGFVFAERRVLFMLMFPMKAKTLAMILFFFAAYYNFASPGGGVSHIAHLGGALTGLIYLKRAWRVDRLYKEIRWRIQRRRFKVMMGNDDHDRWTH